MAKKQVKDIKFGGLSNNMDESLESEANAWLSLNTWHDKGILEGIRRYVTIGRRSSGGDGDVAYGMGYGKVVVNERQKITITGAPTGGTFTITYSGQTTATITYAATAQVVQSALEALSNIAVGDVIVTGGPLPAASIEVEFIGSFAQTDVALMTASGAGLTGGTTPAVTITEKVKGGSHEVVYTVIQPGGSGDATLYAVTSTDDFATTTWATVATDFNPSDWYFEQFFDKMFMSNSTDGLKWIYIGTPTLGSASLAAPGTAPSAVESVTSDQNMVTSGTTWAATGIGTAPTLTAGNGSLLVTFNSVEDSITLVLTGTLAADKDWSLGRDVGRFMMDYFEGGMNVYISQANIDIVNADASPVTIRPDYLSRVCFLNGYDPSWRWFHFADEARASRDNIHKVVFTIFVRSAAIGDKILFNFWLGDTWPNDTRALVIDPPQNQVDPVATKTTIDYAYSYYDVSESTESALSPIATSQVVPSSSGDGCKMTLTAVGSRDLNTTDDRVLFYRKERSTGKWRRLPNTATPLSIASYGAVNATATNPSMSDTWMEHELGNFPEPEAIGFPPNNTGATADVLGVWKQCLTVGSNKLAYLSWVGQPLRFEPSPDTPNYISPDPVRYPDVGVTEYVSDNRSENVLALVGQDSLYAITGLSAYAKVGDSPASASVFRRLPGSRGALSKRAVYRYGGGILIGSQDGLWYYSVGRGFSGEDNGALVEREETGGSATTGAPGVRRSYQRLISELQSITLTGTDLDGTFDLTFGTNTATIAVDATPLDVQRALEDFEAISVGDVEVFGDDLVDADGNGGGTMYVRFIGYYAATNVSAMTADVTNVTGTDPVMTIDTLTSGGGSNLIVFEFNDEYWLFNQKSWLHQSRSRKWSEGIWSDSIKAVVANRERGVLMLSTTGKLLKLSEGVGTDSGATVRWQYESPWMTGPRARVLSVYSVTQGAPTFRLYSDDGAGSVDTYAANSPHTMTVELDEGRFTPLPASNLPGVRHKVIISGVCGRDKVKYLGLGVQPDGTDQLGS